MRGKAMVDREVTVNKVVQRKDGQLRELRRDF
jgi:hypothetical protein